MTKTCKVCLKEKVQEMFSARASASDGYQSRCKDCSNVANNKLFKVKRSQRYEYRKDKFKELWNWYVSLKDNQKCMDCKVPYAYYQLDYDHRDPTTKIDHVGMLLNYGKKKVLEEIAKCDLVCKNCHA